MPNARKPAAPRGPDAAAGGPRVLKKYPNRRLYDTRTSSYITLADVKRMVLEREDFEVRDAKSGDEITRSILLQIILEEETGGVPLFSSQVLAQIIRFYGHAMQGVMGPMIERNMQLLAEMQQRFAEHSGALATSPEAWGQWLVGQAPWMQTVFANYAEQSRKLVEQMQRPSALGGAGLFGPLGGRGTAGGDPS